MQSILVGLILAMVVIGLLVPLFRRDIRTTRDTFEGPKPTSAFTRLYIKMKDHFKNG